MKGVADGEEGLVAQTCLDGWAVIDNVRFVRLLLDCRRLDINDQGLHVLYG